MENKTFQERLSTLIPALPAALGLHDARGLYLGISPAINDLLGYTPAEVVGRSPLEMLHAGDISRLEKAMEECGDHPTVKRLLRWESASGETKQLEILLSKIPSSSKEAGETAYFSCLREPPFSGPSQGEDHEEAENIFQHFPLPAYTWVWSEEEKDFILQGHNRAAEVITKGHIREKLGITAQNLYFEQKDIPQNMQLCLEKKKEIQVEHRYVMRTTNEIKYFLTYYTYLPEKTVLIYTQDITTQVKYRRKNEVLARFPEENPHPVLRVSYKGKILYSNRSALSLLAQWKRDEGRELPDFWRPIFHEVQEKGETIQREISLGTRYFLFAATPISADDSIYLYGFEITAQRQTEEKLYLTSRIFDTTIEGISVTDPQGNIQSINPAFTRITGYTEKDVIGLNPRVLKSNRHPPEFYKEMWKSLLNEGMWEGEVWNRRKDGETYPEWLSINAIKDDVGHVQHYVAVFTDISEIKMKEMELHYQAFHDPLTGLPNRNLLDDRTEQLLQRLERDKGMGALIFMDLDRFKMINDSLGHIVGDYLLQEAAGRIKNCIRSKDTVSRVGGDEFVLLLTDIKSPLEAGEVAERILESFESPFFIHEHELFAATSIGITLIKGEELKGMADYYKEADIAMYQAKEGGGQSYQFFSPEGADEIARQLQMENFLRRALEQDQFTLYYQPIVDPRKNTIVGCEALIRWNHPELGFVSPGDFIPLAHETGLIREISCWVIGQACRDNLSWGQGGFPNLYCSVNITGNIFQEGRLQETVDSALAETGIPPEQLILEITEDSLMENIEGIIPVMHNLRSQGIRFSIDDFGTGFSSLSYLKKFPLDNLKIDQSFVVDLPHDSEGASITRAVIALARSLDLKIIAEGVEEKDQLDFFRENPDLFIQGYYYSRPLPPEDFIRFCQDWPTA